MVTMAPNVIPPLSEWVESPIEGATSDLEQLSKEELIELLKNVKEQSTIDPVTRLVNRNATAFGVERVNEFYKNALETYGDSVWVLSIDVNNMKLLNDKPEGVLTGHERGDYALRKVGDVLSVIATRDSRGDDLFFRNGGDEFGGVVTGVADEKILHKIIDRINASFAEISEHDEVFTSAGLTLSVSVGFVRAHKGSSVTKLLEEADASMYETKRTRKWDNPGALYSDIDSII